MQLLLALQRGARMAEKPISRPSRPGRLLGKRGHISEGVSLTGFGEPEPEGRWTLGSTASFAFRFRPLKWPAGLTLHLKIRPFMHGQHRARASFRMDDELPLPLSFNAVGWTRFTFPLTSGAAEDQEIICRLEIENPVSPVSVNQGDDSRLLGVMIASIELRAAPTDGGRWRQFFTYIALAWRSISGKVASCKR